MENQRPHWRFRISTLMLLVIILALALALVSERWKREQELRRLEASLQRAVSDAQRAATQSQAFAGNQPPRANPRIERPEGYADSSLRGVGGTSSRRPESWGCSETHEHQPARPELRVAALRRHDARQPVHAGS
jgi:hypothetical protein